MHTIHHTRAFILKSQPAGEANRRVWLFTEEFGLVVAVVQGVRRQGAKLQMHLAEYSLIMADLIRGKDTWRLISVPDVPFSLIGAPISPLVRSYVRTLAAVERFCQGEEAHPELFEHLLQCISCTAEGGIDVRSLDTLSLAKVMCLLGYSDSERIKAFDAPTLAEATKLLDDSVIRSLIKETNVLIAETHL